MARVAPFTATPQVRGGVGSRARLALVDSLLAEQEVRPCAVLTLRWLARHAGIERGLCAVVESESSRLVGLTGLGLSLASVDAFSLELNDRMHPLVVALAASEPVSFPGSGPAAPPSGASGSNTGQGMRQPLDTPLGADPFVAVPLAGPGESGDIGPGLLLLAGMDASAEEDTRWAAEVLGVRLQSLWFRRSQVDERRYKREQSWLFGVINAVTDPILLTDSEGRILVANGSAEMLLTADDQKSEGRRRAVALNNMLFSASIFTSSSGGGPTRHELLLVDPTEGQDLLFEVMSTPVKIRVGETGTVSVLRNVTDLRRATDEIEENYRRLRIAEAETRAERDRLDLILNSALDPILVTDPSGNIVLMNPPAERMFTVSQAGNSAEAERRVRANDAVFTSFMSGLYASQSLRWRGELSLIDPKSSATVPVEAISGKVLSKHGEDTAVVTILHDLTEAVEKQNLYEQVKRHSEELREKVREATAELAEQNELLRRQAFQLEQASAAKSQFLANVSHELRTPLNAIIGYTHLLLEGVSGDLNRPQSEKLGRLESNARHLLSIINDLLDLARIESGKMPVQLERVVLQELIDEVMTEVEPLIDGTKLTVTRNISEDVPEIHTDRQKVKQIVLNLLSNALKFTPTGSVSIRLDYEPGKEWISVAVADTGIGISEDNQKTIFEAFQQADSSYARRTGGTGLGLTICRRLASILDGQITLVSKLGEGSTFTLVLPRQSRAS
ncbi:MAG TPA: ATP-binding protein [Thermoanaerobaculia bacterium]|nr:ATP-binding protein [Thermoanaerobaculia bacterium]